MGVPSIYHIGLYLTIYFCRMSHCPEPLDSRLSVQISMVDIPTKFTCTLDHTSKNLRWMGVPSIYHIGRYLNFCKLSKFKPTCSLDSPFQKNRNQISVCLTPFAADAFRTISTKENLSIQLCVRTARSTGKFRKRNI